MKERAEKKHLVVILFTMSVSEEELLPNGQPRMGILHQSGHP